MRARPTPNLARRFRGWSWNNRLMAVDMEDLKIRMDDLAHQVADAFGEALDHSVDSVQTVERILAEIHRNYKKTGNVDGLNGLALEFAAHIIKVIDANYGPGEWTRDHPKFGEGSLPYRWRGTDLFPYSWCQKRIFDGPADNVWSKFEAFQKLVVQTDERGDDPGALLERTRKESRVRFLGRRKGRSSL